MNDFWRPWIITETDLEVKRRAELKKHIYNLANILVEHMTKYGFCVIDNTLGNEACNVLLEDIASPIPIKRYVWSSFIHFVCKCPPKQIWQNWKHFREAIIKKSKCKLFQKRGGVDPKVYIFEILNFGKFQFSKWAYGIKRLFKVSFRFDTFIEDF